MKILIATGIFVPEAGGPATYAPKIAQEFLELGHEVKILTYSDQSEYDFDKNFPYTVRRIKRGNKLLNYWRYYKALKKEAKDCNIIYSFDHFSAGMPAAKFCQRHHKPLYIRVGGDFIWERHLDVTNNLVTLHDFYKKDFHHKAEGTRFRLIQWVFSKATGIIFTTDFQRDIFKEYYNLGPEKLFIINNPIDKNIVRADRSQKTKEVIFSGRFINKNNLGNLIKAWHDVKDKSFTLVLIGEGPAKAKFKKLAKDLKITNIKFEDRMSREDLNQRVAKAYLAIWPSLTDISPNSMLEALRLNVPILSSSEIGFNWLKDKIFLFNPLSLKDITAKLNYLLVEKNYQEYSKVIEGLTYDYNYSKAAQDTIKIFKN